MTQNTSIELRTEIDRAMRDVRQGKSAEAIVRLKEIRAVLPDDMDLWLHNQAESTLNQTTRHVAFSRLTFDEAAQLFLDDLLCALDQMSESDDPFQHGHLQQIFHEDRYEVLEAAMPTMDFFQPRRDKAFLSDSGAFQRYELDLSDKNLHGAGNFKRKVWLSLTAACNDQRFVDRICKQFGLEKPSSFHILCKLMCDRRGFQIAPHTDGANGSLVTFQIYMPTSEVLEGHGTEVGWKDADDKFRITRKFPFVANCGHIFPPNADSWHAVTRPIPQLAERRYNLVIRLIEH